MASVVLSGMPSHPIYGRHLVTSPQHGQLRCITIMHRIEEEFLCLGGLGGWLVVAALVGAVGMSRMSSKVVIYLCNEMDFSMLVRASAGVIFPS